MSCKGFLSCFVFSRACAAHQLRAAGNTDTASALGNALKDIGAQMAADGEDGRAEFRDAFADEVNSQLVVPVNSEVSRVLAEANAAASMARSGGDDLCERNWEAPCPDGWRHVGSGQCVAPSFYVGGCAVKQLFEGVGVDERVKFASNCEAVWPCADGCAAGRDYDGCPLQWSDLGDGLCSSPAGAVCGSDYKFTLMSVKQKQEFSIACESEWPCRG